VGELDQLVYAAKNVLRPYLTEAGPSSALAKDSPVLRQLLALWSDLDLTREALYWRAELAAQMLAGPRRSPPVSAAWRTTSWPGSTRGATA
jgi:hypothetical protein